MTEVTVIKIGGSTFGRRDTTIEDIVTLQKQGQSLVTLKRFDEAKRLFDGIAKEGDAERFAAAVQRQLASIALQQGNSKEALRLYEESLKKAQKYLAS